jgi:hypothetical protein
MPAQAATSAGGQALKPELQLRRLERLRLLIAIPTIIVMLVLLMRWQTRNSPLRAFAARRDMPARRKETPRPIDENVQFTVFRPEVVVVGEWSPLLVFMHLSERRPDQPKSAHDPLQEVEKQAEATLGALIEEHTRLRQDSAPPVPRTAEITIVPRFDDVEVNPPSHFFSLA